MDRHGDAAAAPSGTCRPARRAPDGRRHGRNGRARSRSATPRRISSLCSSPMACSLPGMMREEKITTSPASSATSACSPRTMRASAERGSPWLPVQIISTLSRGRWPISPSSTNRGSPARYPVSLRRLDHAPERAADEADMAVMGQRRRGSTLSMPRHVAGKAGDGDALVVFADQLRPGSGAPRPRSRSCPPPAHWWNRRSSPARPRRPARRSAASSVIGPMSGSGSSFQSPVCSTAPSWRADHHGVGLGDRMGERDQLDLERPDAEIAPTCGISVMRASLSSSASRQLAAQHGRGEGRRVDRAAQARPEIGHGADMVLMGVGQDQPRPDLSRRSTMKAGSGMMTSMPGVIVVAEGDAEIDHQPLAGMAVEIEVHADLAAPAERQEQQLARRLGESIIALRLSRLGCVRDGSPPGRAW